MEGVFPRRGPKECGQNKVPTLGARGINFERTELILTLRETEADQKIPTLWLALASLCESGY